MAGLALFSLAAAFADGRGLAALALLLGLATLALRGSPGRLAHLYMAVLPFIVFLGAATWLFAGALEGALAFVRVSLLYLAGSLVTATTTEAELIDVIERLLAPAGRLVGHDVGRDVATMMALAIAFLPAIRREHDAIRLAQEARGVSYSGITGLIRGEMTVLVPLIRSLAARADRVALAMEARCYGIKK